MLRAIYMQKTFISIWFQTFELLSQEAGNLEFKNVNRDIFAHVYVF